MLSILAVLLFVVLLLAIFNVVRPISESEKEKILKEHRKRKEEKNG